MKSTKQILLCSSGCSRYSCRSHSSYLGYLICYCCIAIVSVWDDMAVRAILSCPNSIDQISSRFHHIVTVRIVVVIVAVISVISVVGVIARVAIVIVVALVADINVMAVKSEISRLNSIDKISSSRFYWANSIKHISSYGNSSSRCSRYSHCSCCSYYCCCSYHRG